MIIFLQSCNQLRLFLEDTFHPPALLQCQVQWVQQSRHSRHFTLRDQCNRVLWGLDVGRDFNMAAERGPLAVTIINGVAYTGHRRGADRGIAVRVENAIHLCSQLDHRQQWIGRRLQTTFHGA